jgi:hypothetical protein
MPASIRAPVGRGTSSTGRRALNNEHDVLTVQALLNRIPPKVGGPPVELTPNGQLDDATFQAIWRFQQYQFHWADGVVDPGQVTLGRLNQLAGELPPGGFPHLRLNVLIPTLRITPSGPGPFLLVEEKDDPGKQDLSTNFAFDFTQLPRSVQVKVALMRQNLSAVEMERVMRAELLAGAGLDGQKLHSQFSVNVATAGVVTFGPAESISQAVAHSAEFQSEAQQFEQKLDQQLKRQAAAGAIDFNSFPGPPLVRAPHVHYSLRQNGFNGLTRKLAVLFGSFQGSKVSIKDFTVDPTNGNYSATLLYDLRDHFGADNQDLIDPFPHGTPGQFALWILQRSNLAGHRPFIPEVRVERPFSGTL